MTALDPFEGKVGRRRARVAVAIAFAILMASGVAAAADTPVPLVSKDHPVDWWFAFKFNTASFPECGGAEQACIFGGSFDGGPYSQQYVYASSETTTLKKGSGCVGDTTGDPVGATFDSIYNSTYNYVVWNDQFYDDPKIKDCKKFCAAPWGHSKGMLAWNDEGAGVILQVTTPSWPASGSSDHPRTDGNTLGCVSDDNNIKFSQHFFALKLSKEDVLRVAIALRNASVVTDVSDPQLVKNGGPDDIQQAISRLGVKSQSKSATMETLSTGVRIISKPSKLQVPPWQLVSALLDGVGLRVATWWSQSKIYSTTASTKVSCWSSNLDKPGPVTIATSGQWDGTDFGLKGGAGPNFNHAKIGVSTDDSHYVIFGDMNQEGSLAGNCSARQNGRGGLFFVVTDEGLAASVGDLIKGSTAPTKAPSQ